jgi:hypothetical protein
VGAQPAPDNANGPARRFRLDRRLRAAFLGSAEQSSLEEGWDDPEAYIAYFDGETRFGRRIKQLIGRVFRQPRAEHLGFEDLNSAHLFINTPNERFDGIVTGLQRSLMQSHGTDAEGEANVKVVKDRTLQPAVGLREGIPPFELPIWQLAAGPALAPINERLAVVHEDVVDR